MSDGIEVVRLISVELIVASEYLLDVLLAVLPAGVGVGLHPRPDLLLHHQVHVATGERVAGADDARYGDHERAQTTVHDDLEGRRE